MFVGSYLRLRGGTYPFRVRIPQPLCKAVGTSVVTASLKTSSFDWAVRAAKTIRTGLDSIMVACDQGASYVDIERRVRAWMGRSALDDETWITDPQTGDAICLAGVTTAELKALPKDIAFHA